MWYRDLGGHNSLFTVQVIIEGISIYFDVPIIRRIRASLVNQSHISLRADNSSFTGSNHRRSADIAALRRSHEELQMQEGFRVS